MNLGSSRYVFVPIESPSAVAMRLAGTHKRKAIDLKSCNQDFEADGNKDRTIESDSHYGFISYTLRILDRMLNLAIRTWNYGWLNTLQMSSINTVGNGVT